MIHHQFWELVLLCSSNISGLSFRDMFESTLVERTFYNKRCLLHLRLAKNVFDEEILLTFLSGLFSLAVEPESPFRRLKYPSVKRSSLVIFQFLCILWFVRHKRKLTRYVLLF